MRASLKPYAWWPTVSSSGSLYVGQTTRGWASDGDGLQRLVWTGKTPVEIHSMRLTSRGFRLCFTVPMCPDRAADASNYTVGRFRYVYHQHYGAPRVDEADVEVREAIVNRAGDEVELVLAELEPGFIHELDVADLLSADGRPLRYSHAYYTLNRTLDGRRFEGSITAGAVPEVVEKPRDPDPRLGLRVYRTFCIQCHRDDGRGGGLPGVSAADFTLADGVLRKNDDELAHRIARGAENGTMPPFGYVLSQQQILDVLAYIRGEFDPNETPDQEPSS
jgi:mono/diheme cytochrome c family protein